MIGPKSDQIRPVLDQVKEAIFNILFDVTEANVLDLFAGTGSVGLEALSRGAKQATFVDLSEEGARLIQKNAERCGATEEVKILKMPAGRAIQHLEDQGQSFDLIFVDPPYLQKWVRKTLERLVKTKLLTEKTRIIVEHHPKEPVPEMPGLILTETRKYGQTLVTFLRRG